MSLQSRDAGSLPQKRGIRLLCRYFYYCKTLCNCNVKNKVITILCNNTFQSFSFLLKRKQGKTSFWKKMLWRKYLTKNRTIRHILVRYSLKFLLICKKRIFLNSARTGHHENILTFYPSSPGSREISKTKVGTFF